VVYFGIYSSVKEALHRGGPLSAPQFHLLSVALAAATGNTVASVFRVPYEVLKQRVQAGQFSSAWEAMLQSWRADGPLGLFDAGKLSSQIIRDVPYAILTLVSYEVLQLLIHRFRATAAFSSDPAEDDKTRRPKVPRRKLDDALCGSLAGGIGSLLTNPMDVVKTRLMTSTKAGGSPQTVWSSAMSILRDEGPTAFLIGTPARLMHNIPANCLFFLF